ncbi:TNFAIP3-interacting protein 3 isoform X1 [Dipodomys spectabilis]|uniref:TNFAIP3-interacting protein 3 isoform X1 n=1 Tax=Dipodomys spectabilis TaxID=105255 RepID=UPI001C53B494|nr:TNFAIP3-interacting protein 3 isoform X1 [Dipodomys spectabilis]
MVPRGYLINRRNKKQDEKLIMFANQCEDPERCDSLELDNKIRDLIERNSPPDPKGVTPSHRTFSSPKTPGNPASMSVQDIPGIKGGSPMENAEYAQSSRRKNLPKSLEHKIQCLEKQRKELLEVNQQWDKQFRSMKDLYERKVAELRVKLAAAEKLLATLEKERPQSQQKGGLQEDPQHGLQPCPRPQEKENERVNEELQELKKENKLLREKNMLVNKTKEHYESEIQRLNKVLQDVLKTESSSLPWECSRLGKGECNHSELRIEMEVLRQQVQIYEEDFRKERSDRERLNQEKEELQQINQTSQSLLNRLNSQIKACQMEKEKLEKQLKQRHFCKCGVVSYLMDSWGPTDSGATRDPCKHPTASGALLNAFCQMFHTRPRLLRKGSPPVETSSSRGQAMEGLLQGLL